MNPVVTAPQKNQKGGLLEGGLATDEALASSESLLSKTRHGATKGAQQFFSPPELAAFVKRMIPASIPVLDPTAGDGSLLRDFDPGYSFGVELDTDQINNSDGSYKAVQGDFPHVYTLIRRAGVEFGAIVANPPFDLTWSDPTIEDGKPMSSTKLAFIACSRLLEANGQFIFIAGRDRFTREVAELPEAEGIYAVIEVEDLFDNVTLPCVVACGIAPDLRETERGYETQTLSRSQLDLGATWAQEKRTTAIGRWGRVSEYDRSSSQKADAWAAINTEYQRRLSLRTETRKSQYDVYAEGQVLRVELNAFKRIVLSKTNDLRTLESLNRHHINYFRQNEAAWRGVVEAAEDDIITVDPALIERVNAMLRDNRLIITPLYPLKKIQRLGFLDEIDRIKCVVSDEEKGFFAGERYHISVSSNRYEDTDVRFEANTKTGEWQRKEYLISRRRLNIRISNGKQNHSFFDDEQHQKDIQYLSDHFDLPDPGDMGTRFSEDVHAMRVLLSDIEWDTIVPNSARALADGDPDILEAIEKGELEVATGESPMDGRRCIGVRLRHFQREDLARMLVKGSGLLAWEQGLGKTLGALIYAEACVRLGAQDARLFIVPQDLLPQWQRETKRFFGKDLELIAKKEIQIDNPEKGKGRRKRVNHTIPTHAVAEAVAKRLRNGGTGWFATYYEAISTIGTKNRRTKNNVVPPHVVKEIEVPGRWIPATSTWNVETNSYEYTEGYQEPSTTRKVYSNENCPRCDADPRTGYDGVTCHAKISDPKLGRIGSQCGFSRIIHRVKPAGSRLSTAFKNGVVVVDEITMIGGSANGGDSLRSLVVRGIRGKYRLGMTGTPIKNYINQAFWLLRWTVDQKRFPYAWNGGKSRFEDDFGVIEWEWGGRVKQDKKLLPEITNLSMLWKLLASSMVRRRQEETGEKLVAIRYHEHRVPLGEAQRMQMQKWMKDFYLFFAEKYPDSKVVKSGAHVAMAPMLGMMPKLEYACTLPLADPDHEWTGVEVSNWTPSNIRVLELAMALAKEGRKVLVGSATKETGRWLAEQLCDKGVNAVHILDDDGTTYVPKRRAEVVHAFQTDEVQVFCAGIQAVRLGHNLDAGSAVIIHGPPWDWESFSQFVHRVRRLTSVRDIDCHAVLPHIETKTLNERKWGLLQDKGHSTELALDGHLIEKDEEKIDKEKVMQELVEAGLVANDDELTEADVEALWGRIPEFEDYVAPKGLTSGKTVKSRPSWWTLMEPFYRASTLTAIPVVADQGGTRYGEVVAEDTNFSDSSPKPNYTPFAGIDPDDLDPPRFDLPNGIDPEDSGDEDAPPAPVEEPEPAAEGDGDSPEAVAGGPPAPTPAPPGAEPGDAADNTAAPPAASASPGEFVAAIKELAILNRDGVLDAEEYREAKAALLAQMRKAA